MDAILQLASSPAGVGHEDLARHRIELEKKLSYTFSLPRHILATGEIGLVIPALGRGSEVPEEVKSAFFFPCFFSDSDGE